MGVRRRGSGRLLAVVMLPALVRWSAFGFSYDYGRPPGEGKKNFIHVICPKRCGNQDWEKDYSPSTVAMCDAMKADEFE